MSPEKFKLSLFFTIFVSCFIVSAALLPLRIGGVVSAEITRNKVFVANLGEYDYDFPFKHYAYAVVNLKLHKGRSISIYDFVLKYENNIYKCVALRNGEGVFNTKNWEIKKTDPENIYSLLFIMNSEAFGNAKKTVEADLIYALKDNYQESYKLSLEFINYAKLTPVDKIPANGIYSETKIDTSRKPDKADKNK